MKFIDSKSAGMRVTRGGWGDNPFDPYGPHGVIGRAVACQDCMQVMVPEGRADIVRMTEECDTIIRCPACGAFSWHYTGVDDEVHSGRWLADA